MDVGHYEKASPNWYRRVVLATGTAHATGPDNCAAVSKTPDGFLNVREAPTMKSKIIAKIHPADLVYADAYECNITDDCDIKSWTHIASVLRSSGPNKPQALRGWVATKFLKWRPERYSNCTGLEGRG
jgi:hypothetical protein